MEYLMGGNGFFDFAPSKIASYSDLTPFLESGRAWGSQRLLSNLKAWLTAISNSTMYQVPLIASECLKLPARAPHRPALRSLPPISEIMYLGDHLNSSGYRPALRLAPSLSALLGAF
jgi:hypothetical protein